ncbi:GAF domain-containing protein [Sporolactobacillus sp. Y61]|jgi:GAF domain-containing protein|uniref:GAF domain-containing protein n=1 Tax=Sporolactobacillus sp. Y61 TaxID=3160863 RepID=A0AAU8IFC2_9BACL|nr:GAF domain-containing protein [Sporolactobacillus sp. THM19-2]RYL94570.1 GAF domain-containing protein [Sporolactobacillus sp. THM19-2]
MNSVSNNRIQVLESLIKNETDQTANLANCSAWLNESFEQINWAGFYLFKDGELVLGPFQGKPACIRIQPGKGVCGTAAAKREIIRVADVHKFPGHIACDAVSRSEIVVPLIKEDELIGVIDIDSPNLNRFSDEDQQFLEAVAETLVRYI